MNQEKIGRFLSDLRKEQEMTQQQLADAIGVSNKTISKWECGKGMPEISSIIPLCETLHINVNELLSGERLPEDGYSKKAEENMMSLIHETEICKKKSNNSLLIILVTVMAVLLGVGLTIVGNMGTSAGNAAIFIDLPILFPMLIVSILFLLGTKLGRPFLQSFVIVAGKKKTVSETDIIQGNAAIRMVSNTFIAMGVLESVVGLIAILFWIDSSAPDFIEVLGISITIALLSILYGTIGYLLLLPIRMKLEAMCAGENITAQS